MCYDCKVTVGGLAANSRVAVRVDQDPVFVRVDAGDPLIRTTVPTAMRNRGLSPNLAGEQREHERQ